MPPKNIELELRAAVNISSYNKILAKLKNEAKLISHTQRLSVMFFGKISGTPFDIRVRITNGKPEVTIKKGKLHTHDRIELSTPIKPGQFIKMVELFMLFDFKAEVAERETYNFDMGKNIVFSLVRADKIAYIEIEKMSGKSDILGNKKQLLDILRSYKIKVLRSEKEFNKICDKLSEYSDWLFKGSKSDYIKLKNLLCKY